MTWIDFPEDPDRGRVNVLGKSNSWESVPVGQLEKSKNEPAIRHKTMKKRSRGRLDFIELYLRQDDEEAILPVLEEIELSISRLTGYSDEEYQRLVAEVLAAFEPFVSAHRIVKVCHCEQKCEMLVMYLWIY
jgi:hypothetical protein